jgi:hypothetical protein
MPDVSLRIVVRRSLMGLAVLGSLAACNGFGEGGLSAAACPELGSGSSALGAHIADDPRANAKIRAFVQSAKDMSAVSLAIEAEVADACGRMARDLGIPPAQIAPRDGPGGRASGACAAVSARIDAILKGGVGISVSATPPQCQANASAQAECSGSCTAHLSPGEIVARCTPGKLAGQCQGRCDGTCEGRCNGDCNGNCTLRDASGKCAGQCQGTCSGSCDATCHASCTGTWQAPRCEASMTGPSADAECNASCNAHANVTASCTPAVVQVRPTAGGQAAAQLAATLQANLPALLHAELALGRRLLADAQVVGQVGVQLPKIVGDAGLHAGACVAASAQAAVSASARINVSVQASASVSGKVGHLETKRGADDRSSTPRVLPERASNLVTRSPIVRGSILLWSLK